MRILKIFNFKKLILNHQEVLTFIDISLYIIMQLVTIYSLK